jgi:pimeloyl-ACP methyl ester carboxylesterase
MNDGTTADQWAALLPKETLLIADSRSALPIREITAILRRACHAWVYQDVPGAGHMAPLTRPDLINPLVRTFLVRTNPACAVNKITSRPDSAV